MVMNYSFSEALANKMIAYLTKRPYDEVAAIIQEIQGTAKPITFLDTASGTLNGGTTTEGTNPPASVETPVEEVIPEPEAPAIETPVEGGTEDVQSEGSETSTEAQS